MRSVSRPELGPWPGAYDDWVCRSVPPAVGGTDLFPERRFVSPSLTRAILQLCADRTSESALRLFLTARDKPFVFSAGFKKSRPDLVLFERRVSRVHRRGAAGRGGSAEA